MIRVHMTRYRSWFALGALCSLLGCRRSAPQQEARPAPSQPALAPSAPTQPTAPPAPTAPTAAPATLEARGASGCVGWAASTRTVACVEGEWGLGATDRSWSLALRTGARVERVSIAPSLEFPSPSAVTDDPLPERSVRVAQARLTAGGFTAIASMARTIAADAIEVVGEGKVHYTRTQREGSGDNHAAQFSEHVFTTTGSVPTPIEVFNDEQIASGDDGSEITAYAVEPGLIVVHRRVQENDEGVNVLRAQSWVCDLGARRCQ